ncbi:hypothetical protein PoB_006768900 [Plakobranchus ocellatus]|uniref:Uncharacterized protein n=1 Tax=Plakobranchus ocellatus TaxID=259542 RepID=A0AAV4DAC4_9GAST|nr:hypothetical protein PoB_006768900 [Plakobranchus ocellatus]
MATIKCPAPGCDAEWPLATPTDVLTRLLDMHSATAHAASTHVHAPTAAKAEKVWRPTITASGTSEEWAYFLPKESGKRSATRLAEGVSSGVAAASSYKRQDRLPLERDRTTTCSCCGRHGHSSSRQERTKKCPAYGKTCTKCGTAHHFANVCRKTSRPTTTPQNPSPNALDDAAATFDSLCSANALTQISQVHTVSLDHHVYNEFCKAWERRASDPQPFVNVTICAMPSDIQSLGFHTPISSPTRPVTFPAMENTGCQSCLAGLGFLTKMGLNRRHLLPQHPVSTTVKSATYNRVSLHTATAATDAPDHDPSPGPVIEPLPLTPKATNSKAPVTGLARALHVLMPHNAPGLKEQAARPRIDPSPGAPRRSARLMNPAHTPA